MSILHKAIALLTAGSLGVSLTGGSKAAGAPPEEMFRPMALSQTVVTVDPSGWSAGEYEVLVSLQGITARDGKADIYLLTGNYGAYAEAYAAAAPEQGFEAFSGTVWALAARFAPQIQDHGFVLYATEGDDAPGVNLAATVSAAEGWLGVPEALREQAEACGLVCKRDLRALEGNAAQQQRTLFREYRDRLNSRVLVHQPPGNSALRDFAIAQGALCFYAAENSEKPLDRLQDWQLYRDVFAWAPPNAAVFGVWNRNGELAFVRKLSRAGLVMLPADHMRNGSTLMGFGADKTPIKQPYQNRTVKAEPGKHYAALMLSDGDNLQWLLGDAFFKGLLYDRTQSSGGFPMSFTYAPLMAELFPFVTRYHYGRLGEGMQLICGVSGFGYTNQLQYPVLARKAYAEQTAQHMKNADLHVMQLLDKVNLWPVIGFGSAFFDWKASRIVESFSARENIAGGFWYMDPGKYESGGGRLYRSSRGKLWACNRISFWSPNNKRDTVTPEWIQSMADIINGYPRDPSTAEGYSVINVHPWSISYADVELLVSLLDDDVVLLSAEELLAVMADNIPPRK